MIEAELLNQTRKLTEQQEITNNLLRQMLEYWKSLEVLPDNSYHEDIKKSGVKLPEEKN